MTTGSKVKTKSGREQNLPIDVAQAKVRQSLLKYRVLIERAVPMKEKERVRL